MGFIEPGRKIKKLRRRAATPAGPRAPPVKKYKRIRINSLEQLPADVLYHIFALTDITSNQLHLTNKYFNGLYTRTNMGEYHAHQTIKHQFIHDLNSSILKHIPYVKKLIKNFLTKKITSAHIKTFSKNWYDFMNQNIALDSSVFQFPLINPHNAARYSTYLILSIEDIEQERRNRYNYVKTQIHNLHKELQEYRNQNHEPTLDDLCRLAEEIINSEPAKTQEEYEFPSSTPVFSESYNNIDSTQQLEQVEFLHRQFGFIYPNINPVVNHIIDSSLSVQFKTVALKQILDISNSGLEPMSVKKVLQIGSAPGNDQFLPTVDAVLKVFYKYSSEDKILWDFVIHNENLPLLEIMNCHASPNI